MVVGETTGDDDNNSEHKAQVQLLKKRQNDYETIALSLSRKSLSGTGGFISNDL